MGVHKMNLALPIGSVVRLTAFDRYVMVTGVKQIEVESDKKWDYCGCFYPQGVINSRELVLFDEADIASFHFLGFRDGEGLMFQRHLLETGEMPSPPAQRGGE